MNYDSIILSLLRDARIITVRTTGTGTRVGSKLYRQSDVVKSPILNCPSLDFGRAPTPGDDLPETIIIIILTIRSVIVIVTAVIIINIYFVGRRALATASARVSVGKLNAPAYPTTIINT